MISEVVRPFGERVSRCDISRLSPRRRMFAASWSGALPAKIFARTHW